MKKLIGQILALVGLLAVFVAYNCIFYFNVTVRFVNHQNEELQAKSVELSEYLPFDANSKAVVCEDASVKFTDNLPVIDGAAALYPVFSGIVGSVYPSDSVHFDGTDFTKDSALVYSNTRGAYRAVVDGDVDVVFCAKPSAEQLAYAEEKGVELELVPIGYEAFVFIVNANNPVDNLSVDEVKGVFTGQYRNWNELGGPDSAIDVVIRNEGSGSQTALINLLDGEQPLRRPTIGRGSAIGFSFRFYVEALAKQGGIKMLSLNGVSPTRENIANHSYPIVSNFYAVYDRANTNENVQKLLEWILSEEGQYVVEQNGYVPLEQN